MTPVTPLQLMSVTNTRQVSACNLSKHLFFLSLQFNGSYYNRNMNSFYRCVAKLTKLSLVQGWDLSCFFDFFFSSWCTYVWRGLSTVVSSVKRPWKIKRNNVTFFFFPVTSCMIKKIMITSLYFSTGFQPEIPIISPGLSNQPNAEEVQPSFWEDSVIVATLLETLFL